MTQTEMDLKEAAAERILLWVLFRSGQWSAADLTDEEATAREQMRQQILACLQEDASLDTEIFFTHKNPKIGRCGMRRLMEGRNDKERSVWLVHPVDAPHEHEELGLALRRIAWGQAEAINSPDI